MSATDPFHQRTCRNRTLRLAQRYLLLFVALSVLGGCGTSAPTAPGSSTPTVVLNGSQVLRILLQSSCGQLARGVPPEVYTRVSVTMTSNEWVATAESAAAGSVEVRFRQSGRFVEGTIAGSAVHIPELHPGYTYRARATFGSPASLSGVGFKAGEFNATSDGFDGVGTGSLTFDDEVGGTCTGTMFAWAIYPQQ